MNVAGEGEGREQSMINVIGVGEGGLGRECYVCMNTTGDGEGGAGEQAGHATYG